MTQDDRMETITDPAAIRASDEPDERGDFPCCTTPAPASGVGLDLDAIEAAALADDGWWSVPAFALVAEVRRLAALCIPLTDLAQELDMARQNLHHSRAMSSAHFERAERENARAEAAEAEVGTLRARLAAVESLADEWADRKRSDGMSGNAWIGITLAGVAADLRAALATTGEGQ